MENKKTTAVAVVMLVHGRSVFTDINCACGCVVQAASVVLSS